ncbi:MAG: hypothetical protein Q4A97_07995, partial [Comamonadaceae bacterium]|nr:hypothetical protein [Comamonadaceae bacterium]
LPGQWRDKAGTSREKLLNIDGLIDKYFLSLSFSLVFPCVDGCFLSRQAALLRALVMRAKCSSGNRWWPS